ncbi:Cyclin-D1-binding protein 1 [Blattella germanica]|nr:Cyclin-D1-binding protein 1 [Blattella germanica]
MAESLGNVFLTVLDNMQIAHQQLKGGESTDKRVSDFNIEEFWLKLRLAAKCISNEVTKICLAYSKPPLPKAAETHSMLRTLEVAYVELLSTFYSLPKSCGTMLRKEVHKAVLEILESLMTVTTSLKEKGDRAQKDRLTLTGCVWDACEAIESLPPNSLEVACKMVQTEEGLVVDAVQEIEDEVAAEQSGFHLTEEEEDDEDSQTWSNQDRELLSPCLGLVKTARSCLKRIGMVLRSNGKCETEDQISQLDDVIAKVEETSPAVDELATALKTQIEALLHMVKQSHYVMQDDYDWVDFLLKAADHNNNKLQALVES